jgi:hypothetical protein
MATSPSGSREGGKGELKDVVSLRGVDVQKGLEGELWICRGLWMRGRFPGVPNLTEVLTAPMVIMRVRDKTRRRAQCLQAIRLLASYKAYLTYQTRHQGYPRSPIYLRFETQHLQWDKSKSRWWTIICVLATSSRLQHPSASMSLKLVDWDALQASRRTTCSIRRARWNQIFNSPTPCG